MSRGWSTANQNQPELQDAPEFLRMASNVEQDLYGKNRPKLAYAVYADIERSPDEYRLAMAIKKEQLLVPLDEFSGRANFVVQIHRKIAPGRKYCVAHLVRSVSMVAPSAADLLLKLAPILQDLPGVREEGITENAEDVILRQPAVVLKHLCTYKG